MQRTGVAVLGVWLAACGGRIDVPSDETSGGTAGEQQPEPSEQQPKPNKPGSAGAPSSGSAGATSSGGAPSVACDLALPDESVDYEGPKSCGLGESDVVGMAFDAAELDQLLIGQWLLCGSPSSFGTSDEVGLEITELGTWYKLYLDGSGGLVRGSAPNQHGVVHELDNGGYMQVDFEMAASGAYQTLPQFSRVPLKMRLDEFGSAPDYVKNDARGRCPDAAPIPALDPYTPPIDCALEPIPSVMPRNLAQAQAALRGRWLSCDGSAFGSGGDVGFELAADDSLHLIYPDAQGSLYAGTGFGREGTHQILAPGDSVQLDATLYGKGTRIFSPIFKDEPRGLLLGDFEGQHRYVRSQE